VQDLAQQGGISLTEEEEEVSGVEVPRPRRRAIRKRPDPEEANWDRIRRDVWLRELLSSSSYDEEAQGEMLARPGEEDYTRFEESAR
jgi:hypothetical protein